MKDEVIRINCRKPNKLLTFANNFVKMIVSLKGAKKMANYEHTVSYEATSGSLYEVVFVGYCGNDSGRSDVEGPTGYFIDGDAVELDNNLPKRDFIILSFIERNSEDKRFSSKTEYPRYSEYA